MFTLFFRDGTRDPLLPGAQPGDPEGREDQDPGAGPAGAAGLCPGKARAHPTSLPAALRRARGASAEASWSAAMARLRGTSEPAPRAKRSPDQSGRPEPRLAM